MSKVLKIGWIGTGVMGKCMANHILTKSSHKVLVYNRTASKADDLVKGGALFRPP
jgi:3-hydroxyisobutyrate dehydrogenase-like beta-hydroxyacid dehydrogenase